MAEALVGEFGTVRYYSVWDEAFPSVRKYIPGSGLQGIERVFDFFQALDDADLVIFPDVGQAGLQEWLRGQGIPVFGSGLAGQLERDRWFLKSCCKKYGIDAADAIPVTGIENLRSVLAQMNDVHVKMSIFRGDNETFHHEDQVDTARRLNELTLKMEPYSDRAEFVIEQPIEGKPCVEIGADLAVNVDGIYPHDNLWGYEIKDRAYGGRVGALPGRIRSVVDKLAPILEEFGYRGAMSTETRETKDGSYFLDFTARFPNPPSALQRFMILNWGELLWEAAHGRVVEPDWAAPVGVQLILKSEYGADNPLRVSVSRWDRTVLYGHCAFDGSDYAVSGSEIAECGAACGMGTTLAQALEEACDVAEGIKGRELVWDAGALEELTEAIKTGSDLGIEWE
jgi:hypothetical protein